jgi:spoIIIJ-associated protein
MEYVEAEGNSIDDAIERALQLLGVSRDKVDVEIVSNATKGLFGLGGKKAVVRATMRAPLHVEDGDTEVEAAAKPPPEKQSAPTARDRGSRKKVRPSAATSAKGPKSSNISSEAAAKKEASTQEEHEDMSSEALAKEEPLSKESVEHARKVLEETVQLVGTEASVAIAPGKDVPQLNIDGDTSGLLIGRRGQTLDALEYFINRVASRDAGTTARLVVDSQGYRVRRRESLQELAQRLSDRARKRRKTVTMNPMSPRDRRIVHLALQDDPSIETRSSGKGYFRKLLIIPEGARAGRR